MIMTWNYLDNNTSLSDLIAESYETPVLIFKHSTRCGVSSFVKNRFEDDWDLNSVTPYYLDLVRHRRLSNEIAQTFDVRHESPQMLLIRNGECVLDASHMSVRVDRVAGVLA